MALLIGYGAGAINPYLAFESIEDMIAEGVNGLGGVDPHKAVHELHQGRRQGRAQGDVARWASRRCVPTPARRSSRPSASARSWSTSTSPAPSAASAASGSTSWPPRWRPATPSPTRPGPSERAHRELELGGEYQWRREGEFHLFNPETVFKLQHATRAKRYDIFKQYTRAGRRPVQAAGHAAGAVRAARRRPRRRCRSTRSSRSARSCKRFSTGAMSYGSISAEAHETLAIAMNRIGGKCNTGEGGEDAERFVPDANGDLAALGHQAGGLGPLRRHERVPGQRRRPADQDGPGGQAGRGRPAARATRSTRGSPRPGTRRRASGSSARRRTTTSTPSRTSSSSSTT